MTRQAQGQEIILEPGSAANTYALQIFSMAAGTGRSAALTIGVLWGYLREA